MGDTWPISRPRGRCICTWCAPRMPMPGSGGSTRTRRGPCRASLAFFTAADLAGLGPIPCSAHGADGRPDDRATPADALANGPGALCRRAGCLRRCGDGTFAAQDAAELVSVEYDPAALCRRRPSDALAPGAPVLWDEAPGNLSFRFPQGRSAPQLPPPWPPRRMSRRWRWSTTASSSRRSEHRGAWGEYDPDPRKSTI